MLPVKKIKSCVYDFFSLFYEIFEDTFSLNFHENAVHFFQFAEVPLEQFHIVWVI